MKGSINRYSQKLFSFVRTICKIKKDSLYEHLILENQIQDLTSPNCGQFQLYFYKNLFDPDEKGKIINHKTLNKGTLQTIMNEILSTEVKENEYIAKSFKEEYNL